MSLELESHVCGPLENNVYIWSEPESGECMLVDPGIDSERLGAQIEKAGLTLRYIVNTHGHFDHVFSNGYFKEKFPGAKLLIHEADVAMLGALTETAREFGFVAAPSPTPDGFLSAADVLELGDFEFQILEVPGHSPGSIAIINGLDAIVGDALFAGSIGRTDLPLADFDTLMDSIRQKLLTLPGETKIHPGHGPGSTIEIEMRTNPFILGLAC